MTKENMIELLVSLSNWLDDEIDVWDWEFDGDGYAMARQSECIELKDEVERAIDQLKYYE